MSELTTKILVVDDDLRLRSLLERYLTEHGYHVKTALNGQYLDRALEREAFHLIVLDVMLPGEDGFAICRRLRSEGNEIPIIMLTAKGEDSDRIVGLDIGADDYIAKPFNPRELMSRINAVLRRQSATSIDTPSIAGTVVQMGSYAFDMGTRQLVSDNKTICLTSGEYAVLKVLVNNPREPLSRDKLMHYAKGRDYSPHERSIDVQVSRLRRLIEDQPSKPRYIQTVWGLGYVFVPDEVEA